MMKHSVLLWLFTTTLSFTLPGLFAMQTLIRARYKMIIYRVFAPTGSHPKRFMEMGCALEGVPETGGMGESPPAPTICYPFFSAFIDMKRRQTHWPKSVQTRKQFHLRLLFGWFVCMHMCLQCTVVR
jgi:hypothetical protein